MATPPPLSPEVRAAVLDDIRARQLGRNAIARKHGVGLGSVSNIARENGIHDAFDRSQTARATADRQADLAARRAQLAEDLLDDVDRIRDMQFDPYEVAISTIRDGVQKVWMDRPDAAGIRHYSHALSNLIDKHLALSKHDQDDSAGTAVDRWLRHIMGTGD